MSSLPITVKYLKKDSKLIPVESTDKTREDIFIDSLKDGDLVEVTYQIITEDASYAQISKIHVCIRQLAEDLGYDFDTVKRLVKAKAGLQTSVNVFKSFSKCSKQELNSAIQAVIEIGKFTGGNYNSY